MNPLRFLPFLQRCLDVVAGTPAKGDMLVFDGARYRKFPVGSNTQTIVADSTQTVGVKWAAGGGGSTPTGVAGNLAGFNGGGALADIGYGASHFDLAGAAAAVSAALTAHEGQGATANVHGAVSAATANTLAARDGSGDLFGVSVHAATAALSPLFQLDNNNYYALDAANSQLVFGSVLTITGGGDLRLSIAGNLAFPDATAQSTAYQGAGGTCLSDLNLNGYAVRGGNIDLFNSGTNYLMFGSSNFYTPTNPALIGGFIAILVDGVLQGIPFYN